jgi:paraquat-inducible protein B
MIEANRFKLGLFIGLATLIAFAILLSLGIADIFDKKIRITTIFTESVQGLEQGAPLKLKGVSIGRVTRMTVNLNKNHVQVDMEAILSAVAPDTKTGKFDVEQFKEHIENEIIKGLRCRLDMAGITGMKYIELNYFPASNSILAIKPPEGVLYIPSTASLLSGISSSLSETMARLASINYEEISSNIVETLKSINRVVNDPKIESMIGKLELISSNLETTTENINKTLNASEMKDIVGKLKSNLESINTLSESIRKEVESANIPETTRSARDAFSSTSDGIKDISELKAKVSQTLSKLDESLDSLTEMIDSLGDDPAILLKGKRKPEPLEKED